MNKNQRNFNASGAGAPTLAAPAYFYPYGIQTPLLLNTQGGTSGDPKAPGALVMSAILFYLPFGIPITRWRFQSDANVAGNGFYCGMYDATVGNLIFDIGRIEMGGNVGQFGKGASFDPGGSPYLFDINQNPLSVVNLSAGHYFYAWGGDGAGANTFPLIGLDALWRETTGVDSLGVPAFAGKRWGHNSVARITGNHLPSTLGLITSLGGLTGPCNVCFFA